jgi:hypothetical protein
MGGERRQHKQCEVRTYELLGSLALACATQVRSECRSLDKGSAAFECKNQKQRTASAGAAREKRGAV